MTPTQAWRVLGIAKTGDVGAIRRAYAERLKAMDIDRDVDGYARLREARDAALRWARMKVAVDEGGLEPLDGVDAVVETPEVPAPAESSSWLYAAPAATGESDPTLTTRLGDRTAGALDVTRGVGAAQAPAVQAIEVQRDPFARPVLLGLEQDPDAVMPAWAHEQALHRLLLPDHDADEYPPLEGWEEAMARGHLKAILHNAQTVSVSAFDEVDNWLAGMLMRAWPRSSPLLEPAAAVFGWESERGRVNERPAIAFLNMRLRGLRFLEKVAEPAHPLHKAWVELTTPAQQGSRRGWFVKRRDVEQLLEGVRKNFPELEHHFDHWRVALWERGGTSSDNYGWLSGGRLALIAIILLVQIVRFALSDGEPKRQPLIDRPPVTTQQQDADRAVIERAVGSIFGSGVTFAQIQSRQPDLAALFSANRTIARSQQDTDGAYIAKVRDLVRERMYMTALVIKGPLLEDVQRIRVDILRAARKAGAAQCMTFVRTRRLGAEVALAPSLLSRESLLARRMLEARQLGPPARLPANRTSVSGAVIGRVMDRTGIGEARVRQALNNAGSDADQCAVTIAMLDVALTQPEAQRQALLSVL
ncbi:hypothetical protein GGQ88_001016 [Novosphingobium hassiacum]|uniref:J domain-containing protein n=1 Tax=Novosphingobium hassiacum TaxID=173676 RepID=A0A7W5ZXV4_9SPHN|nr:hypothetical protein [Novosphingobium hassiacum]MBB3859755.1 hypothetical protein [Novosphingobium hassiacum]